MTRAEPGVLQHNGSSRCRSDRPERLPDRVSIIGHNLRFGECGCTALVAPESLQELETWAGASYMESINAGFFVTSYHPDTATVDRLRGYFNAGLSPAEAVYACFRGVH